MQPGLKSKAIVHDCAPVFPFVPLGPLYSPLLSRGYTAIIFCCPVEYVFVDTHCPLRESSPFSVRFFEMVRRNGVVGGR